MASVPLTNSISPHSEAQFELVHPLAGLFERFDARGDGPLDRGCYESLFRQLCRHAPLFGYSDHPDVDDEHVDQVQDALHERIADWTRQRDTVAVEQHAVATFLSALRGSLGLRAPWPSDELDSLLEPACARLCAVTDARYVPLVELFHYHHSLGRHYLIERDAFVELIDWCVAAIERGDASTQRFVAAVRQIAAPVETRAPEEPPPDRAELSVELPISSSPTELVEIVAASLNVYAPELGAELGFGQPLSERLYRLLDAALGPALARTDGERVELPPLVEHALLVHLLGLEDPRQKAVISAAAGRLLVHRLIPAAREIGASGNRHEPVAILLVGVVTQALRPWSFEAPPLSAGQRSILIALLGELATGKARKVLHQEKQHAHLHAQPELVRAAVNRALARWPERVHALSPKQRIDRVAAGFRGLNRVRRGKQPRARDLVILSELLGSTHELFR